MTRSGRCRAVGSRFSRRRQHFSDGKRATDGIERHDVTLGERGSLPTGFPARPGLDARRFMIDQHDALERRDALIVLELFAAVVVGRPPAQHFDDELRIGHVSRARRIALRRSADDRHIGIGRKAGREHSQAQVGAVDTTWRDELTAENRCDGCGNRGVLGSTARHGVDLAVVELVARARDCFKLEVLLECVAMPRRRYGCHGGIVVESAGSRIPTLTLNQQALGAHAPAHRLRAGHSVEAVVVAVHLQAHQNLRRVSVHFKSRALAWHAGEMQVERYSDAATFLAAAQRFLLEREVENSVLGLAMRLVHEPSSEMPTYFAVVRANGEIQGAAVSTRADIVVITRMPVAACAALAPDLIEARPALREITGPEPSACDLAHELASRSGRAARRRVSLMLHELRQVQLPNPIANGRLRQAVESDLPLMIRWVAEFDAAIGESGDAEAAARLRIKSGALFMWEDGVPVSMAARARKTPSGIAVNLVYTPEALRGRGYASACVGTLSQALLDQGNRFVCLYTDVENKTSNAIYQRLGYRPVSDAGNYVLE